MRCFLGFHRYAGLILTVLKDPFGNKITIGVGRCVRCNRCEMRYLPPPSPGDDVEYAMIRESMTRRDDD